MLNQDLLESNEWMPCHHYLTLDPEELSIKAEPSFISTEAMAILKKNKIELTMAYYDFNNHQEDKPTIFFIHGNSFSKEIFLDQMIFLSEKYRVIAVDLLGHGESTNFSKLNLSSEEKEQLAEAFYNPIAMIAEIIYFLKMKRIQNSYAVGWSLGGHLLYGAANENPNLFSSVITIGSPPIQFSYEGLRKGFSDWFMNVVLPEWINRPLFYNKDSGLLLIRHMGFKEKDYCFYQQIIKSDPLARKHLFLKLKKYDLTPYQHSCLDGEHFIEQTRLPVLILIGDKDCGINLECFDHLYGKFNHYLSRVEVIKGAPHPLFSTHYNEYMNTIIQFLEGV